MFEEAQKESASQAPKRRLHYRPSKAIPYIKIKEIIEGIQDPVPQWLIATTYANGNRISETVALKYEDFEWDKNFLYIRSMVKKKKKRRDKQGRELKTVIPIRNSPIFRGTEEWLARIIIDYVQEGKARTPSLQVLQHQKNWAQVQCNKYLKDKAHNLRHSRATHLMTEFGDKNFTIREMADWFCLSGKGLADWILTYGHLEPSHIRNKFLYNKPSVGILPARDPIPEPVPQDVFD